VRAPTHQGFPGDGHTPKLSATSASKGPPAASAAALTPCLYQAVVAHIRHEPVRRRFSHRVYYWLIDLDQPDPAPWWLRPLARFRPEDHIGDPARSIKDNITAFLADHGIDLPGGRIVMLANARSLGYVFNPISVHWCYGPDGALACIVAEVHNTYRQRHAYLLRPDDAGRVTQSKDFYVSPFLTVDGEYLMRFSPPGERLAVTIALHQHGATVFTATLTGRRRAPTTRELLRAQATRPAMAALTSIWIRGQGIRLWARRLPVVPRRTVGPDGLRLDHRHPPGGHGADTDPTP